MTAADASMWLNAALLAMMLAAAMGVVAIRSLLAAVLLMSIFSLANAAWLMAMDAPDVALTEAALGAGVSTVMLLGAMLPAGDRVMRPKPSAVAVPLLLALLVAAVLIHAALSLPEVGDPLSPAALHVGGAYLAAAPGEIGAPNVVTAVLASYRGFDTLGETAVILAGGLGVALMLRHGPRAATPPAPAHEQDAHVALRVTGKLLIPLILLFAFYTQFHGEKGPGGGFQAGVILAAGIVLHALVFGLRATMAAAPPALVRTLAALGVLIYAGAGLVALMNGGAFLDYDALLSPEVAAQIPSGLAGGHGSGVDHHWGQMLGIFAVELGVLLTVAGVMTTIFYAFAGRAAGPATGRPA